LNRAISINSKAYNTNRQAMPAWSRAAILVSMSCLLIPRGVDLQLGSIMINPSRLVITLFSIMAVNRLLSGAVVIRMTLADLFMSIHLGIIALSAVYHDGFGEGLENAIATLTDMGMAYFVARVAVRNIDCYRYFVRIVLLIAVISAVFALVEMLTGRSLIRNAYHIFFPKVSHLYLGEQRLSLYRSLATFRHWILLGLYCVVAYALAVCVKHYHLNMNRTFYKVCLALSMAGVFASLSSGPWMAFILCLFCLVYGRIMRNVRGRWKILLITIGMGFLCLSVLSNRGPIRLAINYLTLDTHTGYVRLAMWESVFALMSDYWMLGWGWRGDWPRAEWYIWSSIDSFFAVNLVRSGIFAVLSIIAFFAYCWYRLSKVVDRECLATSEAKGWIIATVALFITGFTVHFFGNLVYVIYFMLGAGQMLFSANESMLPVGRVKKKLYVIKPNPAGPGTK